VRGNLCCSRLCTKTFLEVVTDGARAARSPINVLECHTTRDDRPAPIIPKRRSNHGRGCRTTPAEAVRRYPWEPLGREVRTTVAVRAGSGFHHVRCSGNARLRRTRPSPL